MMNHVLTNATLDDDVTTPFPYIVLHDVLDEKLTDQLILEYPSTKTINRGKKLGSNRRFSLSAPEVQESSEVTQLWKDFIQAHTTQNFLIPLFICLASKY